MPTIIPGVVDVILGVVEPIAIVAPSALAADAGAASLASPKSSTLIRPLWSTMMFAGFKSRCTMPAAWAHARASATCTAYLTARVGWQTTRRNQLVQGLPGYVLHDHEVNTALRTDVMNYADVGMLQRRDGFRLVLEAHLQIGVRRQMGRQDLDRDRALQPGVAGQIDFAHAARAQQRLDFVWSQSCARGQ